MRNELDRSSGNESRSSTGRGACSSSARCAGRRHTAASGSGTIRSDVAGDPDLLNITRPEIIERIHRDYFAAGADIATTNTFTATTIGQADYAFDADVVWEMNLEGARIARRDRGRGAEPVRRRLDRPAQRRAVALAARRRPDLPRGDVRSGLRGIRAPDPRAEGGRRRPPADRDHLRHAELEGGDRGRARRRAGHSAVALVHRRRPERPQPLRPDRRRILDVGRACEAARRRRQLLARRQ